MNKKVKILSLIISVSLVFGASGCKGKSVADTRNITDNQYAVSSISTVDSLGRVTLAGDTEKNKEVGLFYFLWLGAHASGSKIYDVSDLEENNPEALYSVNNSDSPEGAYHFWGEPLYGYYNSNDPWVITRHIELFTMAGIDYLVFDVTNAVTYDTVVHTMLTLLDKYQKQGWDVPKIMFMTNSSTYSVVNYLYNAYYKEGSACYFPNLWYSPNGKPQILGNDMYFDESKSSDVEILNFFDIKNTQWPNTTFQDEEGFPWMSWTYPQMNYNGTVSVSVAQHTAGKMSLKDGNWGRGFSQSDYVNHSDKVDEGLNFQYQWNTALTNSEVNNVFITGWNEWIAIKFNQNGEMYFVDEFDEEYSRDAEMMKDGYGDNYYLQILKNARDFKYTGAVKYKQSENTIDFNNSSDWNKIRSYPDFVGDAMKRNYSDYLGNSTYTDTTNRNDIASVKVTNDGKKLYLRVETADNITPYTEDDTNWMNIWLGTDKNGQGYNFVINRDYGKIDKCENGVYTALGDVEINVSGKVMQIAVPLKLMGENKSPALRFKVSDNVDGSDVMNFYIQGDSAPIGRLSYTYGYFD